MNTSARFKPRSVALGRNFWLVAFVVIGCSLFLHDTSVVQAAWGQVEEDPTLKDYFYKLLRSGFGTLIMIFCGFGGFAFLYMKREGAGGGQVPVVGVVMLLVAVFLFIFRVMITSGLMGSKYLDYGQ